MNRSTRKDFKMSKDHNYTRICRDCGHRRFVPEEIATMKKSGFWKTRGTKPVVRVAWTSAQQTAAAAQESKNLSIAQNAMCPECGSSNFIQYKPGKAPSPENPEEKLEKAQEQRAAKETPAWKPDPFKRYKLRYWEGHQWSAWASTGDKTIYDPLKGIHA